MMAYLIIASVASSIIFIFISNFILGNIKDWNILMPAEYNQVICDMPVGNTLNLHYLKSKPPVVQLLSYISIYPQKFGTLALQRLYFFFFLIRPYYSKFHNIYLCLLSLILYIPLAVNFILPKCKRMFSTALYPISVIVVFCIAVSLQCDDYHNRFHHTIIPIFLYCGTFFLLEKLPLTNKVSS
jgi:hypothetical protein